MHAAEIARIVHRWPVGAPGQSLILVAELRHCRWEVLRSGRRSPVDLMKRSFAQQHDEPAVPYDAVEELKVDHATAGCDETFVVTTDAFKVRAMREKHPCFR